MHRTDPQQTVIQNKRLTGLILMNSVLEPFPKVVVEMFLVVSDWPCFGPVPDFGPKWP